MLLLHVAQNLTDISAIMNVLHSTVLHPVIASVAHTLAPLIQHAPPPDATAPQSPTGSGSAYADIVGFANSIKNLVQIIGAVVFVISLSIAAMMRMMTFGGQQRIMFSNMALTSAVIGLVILVMAGVLANLISQAFK